jgi:hypothetical protein
MKTINVKAGTLVFFEGVGIQVRADFNDPEFGSQPYVTINTDELPPAHRYDERTGLRGDSAPYRADCLETASGEWVVRGPGEAIVARTYSVDDISDAEAEAERIADSFNEGWEGVCGMPAVAVHLNDATLIDDEGKGAIQRADSVKTDQYEKLEKLASAVRIAVKNREIAVDGDVADALYEFDREG